MTTIYNQGKVAKPNDPFYTVGKCLTTVQARHLVDVSENTNGDVYVLAESLSYATRVHRIVSATTTGALTAATNNDIGFYRKDADGVLVAIDADILIDGANYASGIALGTDLLSGLSAADAVKSIGELLGLGVDQEPSGGVVLALTMNTKATTQDRTLDFDVLIEQATR